VSVFGKTLPQLQPAGDLQGPELFYIVQNGISCKLSASQFLQYLQNNATYIAGIPVSTTPPTINQVLVYNGSEYVPAAQGASFSFGINSFTNSQAATQLMGSGTWKGIGALSFQASYANGPAVSANVSMSGAGNSWSPNVLNLTNNFSGPTASTQGVNYPSSIDNSITFSLNAAGATNGSASQQISTFFTNYCYIGVSTKASGYVASDITGLATQQLQAGRAGTFNITAGSGQYIVYAYPARYGNATFTVGSFQGGFQSPPQTLSITNTAGYTENYYVYTSTNSNLGSIQVSVS
jgi:hypothetical protein